MSSMFGNMGVGAATGSSLGRPKVPRGYSLQQNFTPEQMQLFQSLFSNVSPDSFTSRLARGDESSFQQYEEPAMRQFAGLQGNIASRFSGMGSGARRSSGFQNELTQGASQFAQDLASQRLNLQRQALQDLMSMSESLLGQSPYSAYKNPQSKSFLQKLLGGGSGLAGAGIGALLGGPAGAAFGGSLGGSFGRAFQ